MRKRSRNVWLPLVGAMSVSVGLLGGVGCSSSQPGTHAVEEGPSPTVAARGAGTGTGANADEVTTPVTVVESTETAPRPAQQPGGVSGGAAADASRDIDAMTEREWQRVSELEAASAWALSRARQLVRSGQWARARDLLRDIEQQFGGRTLDDDLRRNYSEIQSLLATVESYLGAPSSGSLAAQDGAHVQQVGAEARHEANARFEEGKRAMAERKFREALDAFERVQEVLRWAPNAVELEEEFGAQVRDLITQARLQERSQQSAQVQQLRQLAREAALLEQMEQERRERENIEALWGDALFNMQLKRYETAERIAEMILAQDPNYTNAREMLGDIKSLRLRELRERAAERKVEMYRRLWAEWYEAKVPLAGHTIEFPSNAEWQRIVNRANRAWRDVAEPPEVRQLQELLATRRIARVHWDGVRLADVLREISAETGIQMSIDPQIEPDLYDEFVRGRRGQTNLPVRDALNQLLGAFDPPLRYIIRDGGYLFITSEDNDEVTERMVLRLHDVRDLAMPINNFPGPRIRLQTSSGGGGAPPLPPEPATEGILPEDLAYLIEQQFPPDTFQEPAAIMELAGQLFVRAPVQVQNEVRMFLEELRDAYGIVVTIEARFITVDDMYLSDFGVDWRGLGGQSPGNTVLLDDVAVNAPDLAGGTVDNASNSAPPGQVIAGLFFNDGTANTTRDIRGRFENIFDTTLGNILQQSGGLGLQYTIFMDNDKQFQLVLHALQKSRNATIMTAPRLSAFNAQQANITVMNQVAYIREFSVTTSVGAAAADPEVDTIADGMVLDIRPTVSNDRRFITIELQPSLAELIRPIPEFVTTLGGPGSPPVTIQLPELVLQSLQTTVMCPDGGVVVVGGLKSIRDIDRESTTPLLGDIPIIGTLFRRKGRSLENRSLIVIVKAMITDLREEETLRQYR